MSKIKDKEYLFFLRKDLIDLEECASDIADYYFKIFSEQRYGGIKAPIKTYEPIQVEMGETKLKLMKQNNNY